MKEYLNILFNGNSLNSEQAEIVMNYIIEGKYSNEQISAFLGALRARGEKVEEIVGFVRAMRKKAVKIDIDNKHLIDVCGTGGDGKNTFNISTASAFVIAASGIPVAKHGNRAISSKCGSTDVLSALGIKTDFSAEKIPSIINEIGIAFLAAPIFHPAMKSVAPIRQSLGVKTVFNLLGPLCNPTGLKRQVIGVYDQKLTSILANALKELGSEEVIIVSSDDGMDEVSLSAKTEISHLKENKVYSYSISPEDFGFNFSDDNLEGGTPEENAEIIYNILKGEKSAKRDIVIMNASTALVVSGLVKNLKLGVKIASEAIDSGKALNKLEQLRKIS
ncbi:MAG: anthranilate phosphoribosyltransferase [Cyanobacteriota bacterium]